MVAASSSSRRAPRRTRRKEEEEERRRSSSSSRVLGTTKGSRHPSSPPLLPLPLQLMVLLLRQIPLQQPHLLEAAEGRRWLTEEKLSRSLLLLRLLEPEKKIKKLNFVSLSVLQSPQLRQFRSMESPLRAFLVQNSCRFALT